MVRCAAVLLVLVLLPLGGCASSTPAPRPAGRPFDDVRRVAVVVSGESRFTVLEHSAEPGRTFDEVLKWTGYGSLLRPLAELVHRGITWLVAFDRKAETAPDTGDVSPRAIVADAFAQALRASVEFDEIRTLEREPTGDDRRRVDAIVHLTVPAWGIVRVREGDPDLLSGFADVRGQMVIPATGVVVWESSEDVTDPERLPLDSFTRDRRFTRDHLVDVLERAGRRLASELLYARSAGR